MQMSRTRATKADRKGRDWDSGEHRETAMGERSHGNLVPEPRASKEQNRDSTSESGFARSEACIA